MDRQEWIRRYQSRWIERVPRLPADRLDDEELARAYATHVGQVPDNPEGAVDHLITVWIAESEDESQLEGEP